MVDSIKTNSESSGAQEEDQFAFDDPDPNTLNSLKKLRTSNSFVPFNDDEFVFIQKQIQMSKGGQVPTEEFHYDYNDSEIAGDPSTS